MQYIKGLSSYENDRPTAITIGKFDGLHLGHELLIQKIIEYSKQNDVDSVVLAFEIEHLKEQRKIQTSDERKARLENRVDYLVECELNAQMVCMEAENFIENVLVQKFHAKYIVVGEDFCFGHQKKGNWKLLKECEEKFGFQVEIVPKLKYNERDISSSYIREAMENGDEELVENLLGYSR